MERRWLHAGIRPTGVGVGFAVGPNDRLVEGSAAVATDRSWPNSAAEERTLTTRRARMIVTGHTANSRVESGYSQLSGSEYDGGACGVSFRGLEHAGSVPEPIMNLRVDLPWVVVVKAAEGEAVVHQQVTVGQVQHGQGSREALPE
jgi:hypothetical protein